jgi:hypothetical protein
MLFFFWTSSRASSLLSVFLGVILRQRGLKQPVTVVFDGSGLSTMHRLCGVVALTMVGIDEGLFFSLRADDRVARMTLLLLPALMISTSHQCQNDVPQIAQ